MSDEEIKVLAEKLATDKNKEDAVFGICRYGGGPDESFIKANKAGLQVFAASLIQASLQCGEALKEGKDAIPLDYEADWFSEDSETCVQYVEPLGGIRQKPIEPGAASVVKGEFVKYGCIVLVIMIVAATVTGVVTIVRSLL